MTNKHKWIVLSILLFVGIPFTGSITGKATGSAQGGCGESEELVSTDTQEVRRRKNRSQPCEAGVYFYDGIPIDFERAVNSDEVSKGVCIAEQSSSRDEIPQTIGGRCNNGVFAPDALEKCKAIAPTGISCADFKPFSETIDTDFKVTKLSPFEFRLSVAEAGEFELDFQLLKKRPAPLQNSRSRGPSSPAVVELREMIEQIHNYDRAHDEMNVSELTRELTQGGKNLSPLALERTACIFGLSFSRDQTKKAQAIPPERFSDKCLWLAPFSPECAGEFDIKHWAQHGRYHPQYLSSWRGLTTGFQSTDSRADFDNPSSGSWNELELNYGPSARLFGNAILDYQGGFTPSDYLSAVENEDQTALDAFSQRNDERNRTLYRRSFQGSLVQLSAASDDDDEPEQLKDNLVITGDLSVCDSAEPSNTDVLCLPSPARIFVGTRNPLETGENSAVFRIQGYKKVTIEDLDLEILPHPDMAWVLPDPHEACRGESCSPAEKRALLEYFIPDHYFEKRWNRTSMIFQSGQSSSSGKINSLMFDKLEEQFTKTSTTEYLCDSGGGTAAVGSSGSSLNDFIQACFDGDTESAYARIWELWSGLFDMHKRISRAGEGFYIFDNDSLIVRNTRIRGVVRESVFQLHANRYQQFDNVLIEGMPAERLTQLNDGSSNVPNGLDVSDIAIGFMHFYPGTNNSTGIPIEDTFYLGNGIAINNGVNVSPLPPGSNCCAAADTGALKQGCSPATSTAQSDIYDHTNHDFRASCEARATAAGTDPFLCENQWTTLTNVTIQNCTTGNLKTQDGRGYSGNFDGLAFMSANGLLFNSLFKNFRYNEHHSCDTLFDVAQRSPCYRHSGNLDRAFRVERNRFVDGQIKNEGNGEPETLNIFANNEFLNVNLQDYHKKWEAYYYFNTWITNPYDGAQGSLKSYLWSQNALAPHAFHANTYGRLNFKGNLVRSNYEYNLMNYTKVTPFSPDKVTSNQNVFLGTFNNFFKQAAPVGNPPTKANDRRCHNYSDDSLYEYAAAANDYVIDNNSYCAGGRWTKVLNTIGTISNQSFGQNLNNCATPATTYRCLLNDDTSSYDDSGMYIADLDSSMTLSTPLEPHFANFRTTLRNNVGSYLKSKRFFHSGIFSTPKRRVSRDFNGRWRGLITNAGTRDARFIGFWPTTSTPLF